MSRNAILSNWAHRSVYFKGKGKKLERYLEKGQEEFGIEMYDTNVARILLSIVYAFGAGLFPAKKSR